MRDTDLSQTKQILEAVINSVDNGLLVINQNNQIIQYNEAAKIIWAKYYNENLFELMVSKISWLNSIIEEILITQSDFETQYKNIHLKLIPILNKNKQIDHLLVWLHDTQLQEASMLSQVADSSPGSLYWKDRHGIYLGCNETMVRTAGLSSKYDIIGKSDTNLWPDNAKKIIENDKMIMKTGSLNVVEETVKVADGTIMYFTGVKAPLKDINGNIIGIIGNSLDITERKRVEELAKKITEQKRKEAEKLSDTMRLVASSIAHELRTPLCVISSGVTGIEKFLPRLLEGYSKAKENKLLESKPIRGSQFLHLSDITKNILSELHSANFVINTLLKKINPELGQIEKHDIFIQSVIEDALSSYPFAKDEEQLIHYEKSINFLFNGNHELLKHVFYNLIKNALYFIKETRKGEIFIWHESNKTENMIHFKDTSKGISQEEAKYLFEAFYSTRKGGTGIGLAFCKMVIESFNGKIICDSVNGEFLEYIITLPKEH